MRAAYNRAQWLDERRSLMQWWGDTVNARLKMEAQRARPDCPES